MLRAVIMRTRGGADVDTPPWWARPTAVALAVVWLVAFVGSVTPARGGVGPANALATLPALGCSVILLLRAPRQPVTAVVSLMAGALVLGAWHSVLPGAVHDEAGWVGRLLGVSWLLTIPLNSVLLTVVPEIPTSRAGRTLLRVEIVGLSVCAVTTLLGSTEGDSSGGLFMVGAAALAVVMLCIPAALVRLAFLWRRATGVRRTQVGLLLAGGLVVIAVYAVIGGLATTLFGEDTAQVVIGALLVAAVPVTVVVATVGHGLYGVRLTVNRLTRWVLTLAAAALAAALVYWFAQVTTGGAGATSVMVIPAALAAAAVGIALTPAVTRAVDAIAPVETPAHRVLRGMAERLEGVRPEQDLPEEIASGLGTALGLDGVTLWESTPAGTEHLASWGADAGVGTDVPLRYHGDVVGSVTVRPAPDPRTLEVVGDLAPHIATAVVASRLGRDLERSKRRLEVVRDDERAQLRRDLHDELSPSLSGMRLAITAARQHLDADDVQLDAMLARLVDETTSAMDVVRRLLDGLRPLTLDALGLEGSLTARAESLNRAGTIDVAVASSLTTVVQPALELAAYRIGVEAMANSVRHSGGSRCDLDLRVQDEHLVLTITDDGHGGLRPGAGVGLDSMRERAEALGGRLEVTSPPDRGTRVVATLPLGQGA